MAPKKSKSKSEEPENEQTHCDVCRGQSDELDEIVSGPVTQMLCPPCWDASHEVQQREIAAGMGEEYDPEYEYEAD